MTETKVFNNNEDRIHNNAIHVRHWSADICGYLEDFLSDHDIFIPDEERECDEGEACLFGDTYTGLEDFITEELVNLKDNVDTCEKLSNSEEMIQKEIDRFKKTICQEFDDMIAYGLAALNRASETDNLTPCSFEKEVTKEAVEFLDSIKKYPEYEINTDDY